MYICLVNCWQTVGSGGMQKRQFLVYMPTKQKQFETLCVPAFLWYSGLHCTGENLGKTLLLKTEEVDD